MATLYTDDLEGRSHLASLAAMTTRVGAAGIVIDEGTFPAMQAPQGVKSYATSDPGDQVYLTAAADQDLQGVRSSSTLVNGHCFGHMLRQNASGTGDSGYLCYYEYNGTALRATISVRDAGDVSTTSSSYAVTASVGDKIWLESTANGSAIETRVWTGAESARPGSATHSITNSLKTTGRPGFRKVGSGGTYANADEIRIVDNPADFSVTGVTGSITLDDFTLAGAFAIGALSQLSGSITFDNFVLSGFMGLAPGRVDTAPFKNWAGTLLPGVTVPNVVFLKLDRTTALALTNQVTAGDAVMTITNAALVAGTYYVMVSYNADGTAIGAELVLAT